VLSLDQKQRALTQSSCLRERIIETKAKLSDELSNMFTLREKHVTLTGHETLYGIIELWRDYDVEYVEREVVEIESCGGVTCLNAVKLGRHMHALSIAQRCTAEIKIYVESSPSTQASSSR
jgi:hypothetical protein